MQKTAYIEIYYQELPFFERFKAAKNDGFDYVELRNWYDRDLDEVKKASEEAGITVSGFNGDMKYSLCAPAERDNYIKDFKDCLAAVNKLGVKYLTVHSNSRGPGGVIPDDYHYLSDTVKTCAMFDTLKECTKLAEEAGVTLLLEAMNTYVDHVGTYLTSAVTAAEITRMINSPNLKIAFDAYHEQVMTGNLCAAIDAAIDQIGRVHVADVPGRHEPGTGEINYNAVIKHLEKKGFDGIVGLEAWPVKDTATAVNNFMSIFK